MNEWTLSDVLPIIYTPSNTVQRNANGNVIHMQGCLSW